MPEREWELRRRTMDFAVAANYRARCRSPTDRVFVAKAATVIEEADECAFWLEFMVAADLASAASTRPLAAETHELVAIFVSSRKTATARMRREKEDGF